MERPHQPPQDPHRLIALGPERGQHPQGPHGIARRDRLRQSGDLEACVLACGLGQLFQRQLRPAAKAQQQLVDLLLRGQQVAFRAGREQPQGFA